MHRAADRSQASPHDASRTNKPSPSNINPTDPRVTHKLIGPTLCSCGGMVHESDDACSNGGVVVH